LPSSSNIQNITMRLYRLDHPKDHREDGVLEKFLTPWRAVDELFSDVLAFPLLQTVNIAPESDLQKTAICISDIRGQFPASQRDRKLDENTELE
ncbi:hypothetical protein V5O48_017938, partial [Marasmius crinis-equi]